MTTPQRIFQKFKNIYGQKPRLFRSPGRINLIGEHMDYNEGYVLPAGIDKAVYFELVPRSDARVDLQAADSHEFYSFCIYNFSRPKVEWHLYQAGILDQLLKLGKNIGGLQALFGRYIPPGA